MENREAIDLIRQMIKDNEEDGGVEFGNKDKEALTLAISALEQERWIPVTERLPEKDCSCRVTEGDFKSVIDCHWNNHKKRFEIWSDYNDCYLSLVNVTAWKPVEEPYTEEDND